MVDAQERDRAGGTPTPYTYKARSSSKDTRHIDESKNTPNIAERWKNYRRDKAHGRKGTTDHSTAPTTNPKSTGGPTASARVKTGLGKKGPGEQSRKRPRPTGNDETLSPVTPLLPPPTKPMGVATLPPLELPPPRAVSPAYDAIPL